MAGPKRHHYVPRVYLDRFSQGGQVFVRRRDGSSFTSNCINVAVECGFYDVQTPHGEKSKEVEEFLSEVEGAAAGVLRTVDETMRAPERNSHDREVFSRFLALQMMRTPELRERVSFPTLLAGFLDGRELTGDLVAEYLEKVHLGFKPTEFEIDGAFTVARMLLQGDEVSTADHSVRMILDLAPVIAPKLAAMEWSVEHDRKGRLITSDTPLVLWRRPTFRDSFEGFGIEGSEEIRFPLDPTKQLTLSPRPRSPSVRISPQRAAACNKDIAAACHKFVVSTPLERRRTELLDLQSKRPLLRFNIGPLLRRQADGTTVEDGEVFHMWVPRR